MSDMFYDQWEPVIGLEMHVQLNTKSKVFSSAPNHYGDEPNYNISALCTGQPGSLPVLNKEVVKKAVQFGLAIDGDISLISTFDRKSFFYPDSPRNFQITQYENPISTGGQVKANGKSYKIERTNIEDDSGNLKHFNNFSGIDFNRAGAPLIEIVSKPCIHNPKDATAYAAAIRAILLYIDASDCNMEEGSLRIDANISVRLKGETALRPRIEIKNMNSLSFMEKALETEIRRQVNLYLDNPDTPYLELVTPGTYRWDAEKKQPILMRKKGSADDYRYFPEPDLTPVILTEAYIDKLRNTLPELPNDRLNRYVSDLGLTESSAEIIVNEKTLSDYFEKSLKICQTPQTLCNWITIEFAGRLKDMGKNLIDTGIPPEHMAKLVMMIDSHKITGPIAKSLVSEMLKRPGLDPEIIVENNPDYQPLDDFKTIDPIVDQVVSQNPQSVKDYKNGREKAFSFLVGTVIKLTDGKASPQVVNQLLKKKIEES